MANVGEQLKSPEPGYKRYDDSDSKIQYIGSWTNYPDRGNYLTSMNESLTYGDTIRFKLYSTKLRIIYAKHPNRDSNVIIKIDNIEYSYNPYSTTLIPQVLVFEKNDLEVGIHEIVITKGTNSPTYFGLDAIDIDDDGYLVTSITRYVTMRIDGNQPVYGGFDGCNYVESNEPSLSRTFINRYGFDSTKLNTLNLYELNIFPINIIKTYKE